MYDYIIVGAGAAGCVLANRLSANAAARVLLIEAGGDLRPGREPAAVRDASGAAQAEAAYFWPGLHASIHDSDDAGSGSVWHFAQARVMGGGGSVNGMAALRGLPADYDEWQQLGADGWSWDNVLPYFIKLEQDAQFNGPMHGRSGPMRIQRSRLADLPVGRAAGAALKRLGYRAVPDLNGDFGDGWGTPPMSRGPAGRVSSLTAYLDDETRRRANLDIVAGALAERIIFDGKQAVAVRLRKQQGTEVIAGRNIVVSCGAIYSPALLMRSGLGSADALRALDIDVVHDLPGVGRNLQNHPMVALGFHLPRAAAQPRAMREVGIVHLRYSSGAAGCAPGDMMLSVVNKTAWHALGRRIGGLVVSVFKSYSCGSVELASADPATPPRVAFRMNSDPRDADRLASGLALAGQVLSAAEMRPVINEIFFPDGAAAGRWARLTTMNGAAMRVANMVFSLMPGLRRRFVSQDALQPGMLTGDAAARLMAVRQRSFIAAHVAGTCRMGAIGDEEAVVDPALRVRGVSGLYVADASVMPTIISGNTNIPVIMIAERAADLIAGGSNIDPDPSRAG